MTTKHPWETTPLHASKDELLALVARMRAVSNATYDLFFRAGMGSEAHAFLEFNGLIAKYVDICHRCAEAGIDFRFLNTHSGEGLPVEVHDMRYLGEKLDCILGPAIHANPAAREALREILFGEAEAPETEEDARLGRALRVAAELRRAGYHVIVQDSLGRVLTPEGSPEGGP